MHIYPTESTEIFLESDEEIGLRNRPRVVNIMKTYNYNPDRTENELRRAALHNANDIIHSKLAFFGIHTVSVNGRDTDISNIEPVDVDEMDRKEKELNQDSNFNPGDYRDLLAGR